MSSGLRRRSALWLMIATLPLVVVFILVLVADRDSFADLRRIALGALVLVALLLIGGWAALFLPLFSRLGQVSQGMQRLAGGDVGTRVNDHVPDEIGLMATGVNDLAQQRDNDQRLRADAEDRLHHQVTRDPLTGLLTRRRLVTEITDRRRGDHGPTSVLVVDIDDFRLVNELWGHEVGDEVLIATANRLRRLVGDEVPLGRWGANEFLVVLVDIDAGMLAQFTDRVRALFDEPFNTSVGPHTLACSIGTATLGGETDSVDRLLKDVAVMVQEEKQAHHRARQVSPETVRLVELALSENRLEVWYQPIVEMTSPRETRMVGAEAFVRIRTDDNSLRAPGDFLAEIMTSRYAREIDRRMASLVISNLAAWQRQGLVSGDFLVSLNLSPASLHDDEIAWSLLEQCQQHQVAPGCIVLDVSEEAGELDQIMAAELRSHGFRLSIDDLGLKRSNFDRLFGIGAEFAKLHRRWIDDAIMLEALVNICQRKGLRVVAEGVETMAQLELLFARGVRLCQGYVISRPISADDFLELLGNGRTHTATT